MEGVDITQLLVDAYAGKRAASDELWGAVYGQLRQIAHRELRGDEGHTLSTTALVHEAYLKLIDIERVDWQDRAHFFAIASRAMRNVLIDHAVRRKTLKRGGGELNVTLEEVAESRERPLDELIALSRALDELERIDERQARVVECRFFGGLTVDETAEVLDVSPSTVDRDWGRAKLWLYREMRRSLAA